MHCTLTRRPSLEAERRTRWTAKRADKRSRHSFSSGCALDPVVIETVTKHPHRPNRLAWFQLFRKKKRSSKMDDSDQSNRTVLEDGTASSSDDSLLSLKAEPKRVSFGKVSIREHARLVIDHPFCPDGLGLGLDWKHGQRDTVMDVSLFERKHRSQPRDMVFFGGCTSNLAQRLDAFERKSLLQFIGGYSNQKLMKIYRSTTEHARN